METHSGNSTNKESDDPIAQQDATGVNKLELSYDVLGLIFSRLNYRKVYDVALVCKTWRIATQSDLMWRNLYLNSYGSPRGFKSPSTSWRSFFYQTTRDLSWWKTRQTSKTRCKQLLTAISNSNFKRAKKLVSDGVEIDFQLSGSLSDIPVYAAATQGQTEILRLLLESGADREAKFAKPKETPLEGALRLKREKCVQVLMEFYPEITDWKEQKLTKMYPKLAEYNKM